MYIVVRTEGKHNMGYMGVSVCLSVCVLCACVECVCKLVIKYGDVMKVSTIHTCPMSPPATSKLSCCGDVAREVGYPILGLNKWTIISTSSGSCGINHNTMCPYLVVVM